MIKFDPSKLNFIEELSKEQAEFLMGGKALPKPGKRKIQNIIGKKTYYIVCTVRGQFLSASQESK